MKKKTKNEFINELSDALTSKVPPEIYYEEIEYYSRYFDEEKKKGKSEEAVYDSLGSPLLIAKTIIESYSNKVGGERIYDTPYNNTYSRNNNTRNNTNASSNNVKGWHINVDETGKPSLAFGRLDFGSVFGKIVLIVVLVIVLALILGIVALSANLLIFIALPLVIVFVIVAIVMAFVGRK